MYSFDLILAGTLSFKLRFRSGSVDCHFKLGIQNSRQGTAREQFCVPGQLCTQALWSDPWVTPEADSLGLIEHIQTRPVLVDHRLHVADRPHWAEDGYPGKCNIVPRPNTTHRYSSSLLHTSIERQAENRVSLFVQELLRLCKLELSFDIVRMRSQAAQSRHHGYPQVSEHYFRATGPLSDGPLSDPSSAAS